MNLPNIITLSRIPLMFVIVGLMYCQWLGAASLAFWLFIAAAVGDAIDGYVARKQGLVSNFGKLMDPLTDKIMVLGLVVALVEKHEVPIYLALITLCREFLVTGLRMVAAAKGVVVAADRGGKSKTLVQLVALGFLIGAAMVTQDWARLVQLNWAPFVHILQLIGVVLFFVGTGLAVWSGWRYISQYRAVVFSDAAE